MNKARTLISLFPEFVNKGKGDLLLKQQNSSASGVGNSSSKAFLIADVLKNKPSKNCTTLWIVNGKNQVSAVSNALKLFTNHKITTLNQIESKGDDQKENQNLLKLLEATCLMLNGKHQIIVAPYENLLKELPNKDEFQQSTLEIKTNEKLDLVKFIESLINIGYEVSEDKILEKGTYLRHGDIIDIFPINFENPVRVHTDFDEITKIEELISEENTSDLESLKIYPLHLDFYEKNFFEYLGPGSLVVEDELEIIDELWTEWKEAIELKHSEIDSVSFTTFPEDEDKHTTMHYVSVLKNRTVYDLINDLQDKQNFKWKTIVLTKNKKELEEILKSRDISYSINDGKTQLKDGEIRIVEAEKEEVLPVGFQNPSLKIALITDREISHLKEEKRMSVTQQKVYLDFLTSLKLNDLIVHANHGIGRYLGLEKITVDNISREYLKLGYAENDKLYVPIDQADKVNKYIGAGNEKVRLTRLGSSEWSNTTRKVKKETEKIAKELLELYAKRKSAKGFKYKVDSTDQVQFEASFPYEETPGQIKAINDTKKDMETERPMDRLICGDVGFGKTEVAMRAAFKAVKSGKQVALISPVTILADQHFRSFQKRMEPFHVRIEVLSRFRTSSQQKSTIEKCKKGEVDIVIGTHRLLQKDIEFKNLGLVIVDEEQRFGVKQKETLKQLRTEVDILTLTATPIPRTLNVCLNKLRDISTITTPPPGRLPVITEVRRYSEHLIKEAIENELERNGQIYFLHNRVQTIESVAKKIKSIVPQARVIVAHGQLGSGDLEERIVAFKEHKYDILLSSTIIENGIDLANANTLIVNNADQFGLSQLYQLRGRVGRGKNQAFAYFMYKGQRLKHDAKKRLKAIVEASELGSGFQIAMKDLEIRGAGDVLGVNQHGSINVVGVSHFMRMLNQAVEDLKAGKFAKSEEEAPEVSIELPLTAFIPDDYIVNSNEKINSYQKLSSADNLKYLNELKEGFIHDFGKMPQEVINLFKIIEMKIAAKKAKLVNVKAENIHSSTNKEIVLTMTKHVKPANIMYLLSKNSDWIISGTKLKIPLKKLGINWFTELKSNIDILGKKITEEDKKKIMSQGLSVSK